MAAPWWKFWRRFEAAVARGVRVRGMRVRGDYLSIWSKKLRICR